MVAGYAQFPSDTTTPPANDFAVARYHTNGSLDATFGGDGKVVTDFFRSQTDSALDVVAQPDGKLVVVGRTSKPGSYDDYVLSRYNADGRPDSSFGINGRVIINDQQFPAIHFAQIPLPDKSSLDDQGPDHPGPSPATELKASY